MLLAVGGYLGFKLQEASQERLSSPYAGAPVEVPHGGTGHLAGADWHLVSVTRSGGSGAAQFSYMDMVIAVTPRTSAASGHVSGCAFEATDAAGRIWDPSNGDQAAGQYSGLPASCETPDFGNIPPGRTQQVFVSFLVPGDAAATLRPEVRDSYASPRYLILDR